MEIRHLTIQMCSLKYKVSTGLSIWDKGLTGWVIDQLPIPFPQSPASRRHHRGRGTIILDNVTATTVANPVNISGTTLELI